jgi:hypothetical protein
MIIYGPNLPDRPAPATYEDARHEGAAVLSVTTTHLMDGPAIASKLYAQYGTPDFAEGDPLPEALTVEDVMRALSQQAAECADGYHFWANEPSSDAWDIVQPWAEANVKRLFPHLTWPTEAPDRGAVVRFG